MLEPNEAIKRFSKKVQKYIEFIQSVITRFSKIDLKYSNNDSKKDLALGDLESIYYQQYSKHLDLMSIYIDNISEVTRRAISRNDIFTAKSGITEIMNITRKYLEARKNNIFIVPELFVTLIYAISDADKVLFNIYDNMNNINKRAVECNEEIISKYVVMMYGQITISTFAVSSKSRPNDFPLSSIPIGYIANVVDDAQKQGFIDVGLQACTTFLEIHTKAPENINSANCYYPIIDGWYKICQFYMIAGHVSLANRASDDILRIMSLLSYKGYHEFDHIFSEFLNKLELLAPLSILNETKARNIFETSLLSVPYDMRKGMSLGSIVEKHVNLVKLDEEQKHLNPYRNFIDLNEKIRKHFSNLAKMELFDGSHLFWYVTYTIRSIAKAYVFLFEKPITNIVNYSDELSDNFRKYISVFSWAAHNGKYEKTNYYLEVCDLLSWVGLSFLKLRYMDIVLTSAKQISYIIKSYCKNKIHPDSYFIADLFIYILKIELYAKTRNKSVQKSIQFLIKKPENTSEELWKDVLEKYKLRKDQFEDELEKNSRYQIDVFNSTGLLIKLLKEVESN